MRVKNAPHLLHREMPICHLDEDDFCRALRSYNGTPEAVLNSEELLQALLPAIRADFTAIDTYQYRSKPPLPCPIFACGDFDGQSKQRWPQRVGSSYGERIFHADVSRRPLLFKKVRAFTA
ncbi:MAG: hypothetical protein GY754_02390 [bacterium]|nr:hypothetical protein [bacterium]